MDEVEVEICVRYCVEGGRLLCTWNWSLCTISIKSEWPI